MPQRQKLHAQHWGHTMTRSQLCFLAASIFIAPHVDVAVSIGLAGVFIVVGAFWLKRDAAG